MFGALVIGFVVSFKDVRHKEQPEDHKQDKKFDQYDDPDTSAP